jgi:hypothetical protein
MAAALSSDLPDEVIHSTIAEMADANAVVRLLLTSRWFASRASRPEVWRKLLQDHWGAAAVVDFRNASSCAKTFFKRTRSVPTVLQSTSFLLPIATEPQPQRFVPAPFSEYRLLVEIMHQGRRCIDAVLTTGLRPVVQAL